MRLPARKWWICGLLLLATMVNYMDRLTLTLSKTAITKDLLMSNEDYGDLETGFGYAFAVGSLLFGFAAERWSVRWLYPVILAGWSLSAAACAWTTSFEQLLWCRIVFGLFEAGHWPCAIKTTFASLEQSERTLGNSLLQSGASIASIITPQLMKLLTSEANVSSWRNAFAIVGFAGFGWVVLWLLIIRRSDVAPRIVAPETKDKASLWPIIKSGPFWAVALLIIGAQTCWHLLRVWLPPFLEEGRHFSHSTVLNFTSFYYAATDVGCIAAGALVVWLARRRGLSAHHARRFVYRLCTGITCCAVLIPWLGKGYALLIVFLAVGAGALGLFPCYYSFVQDLSARHVARLTGLLSMWVWATTSYMHKAFGAWVDHTKSFDLGFAIAGLAPLLGVASLALLWPPKSVAGTDTASR